ncbi:Putative Holliday junction resolvase [Aquicella siphonis]|uniref:Putative pre-16S rRNA nuclease n=1 Tax=Aquicella siphonis TaxID=254247 RepID=A0A5E4PIK8_9COXI|nr:Holliday junction resolvase RuvX [Aquicella siphonis]VVC76900.1 Putative Holliday junction resolvase [Aquicella siphonis]
MNSENISTPKILLGFDFGMKRIGVAVGQTITRTARPVATLQAKDGLPQWNELEKLIKRWRPDALVVGIPLNMDGTEQKISAQARQFAELLRERCKLPVHEMDERLTTRDARERLFTQGGFKALQDGQVDKVAAQLILQNWFAAKLDH